MPPIRICLIGNFTPNPDEGMRKSAIQLREALSSRSELLCLNPAQALRSKELAPFEPEIIQYIPGPSPMSLAVLKLLKFRARRARTASMITHPMHVENAIVWKLIPPDIVLTFSPAWKDYLARFKVNVSQIPGAVDTGRFRPADGDEKTRIRRRLGLPDDAFIALHVGHLSRGRGLSRMTLLPPKGVLPLIVVSGSTGQDIGFRKSLIESGCTVIHGFVKDIESYYQASDCYTFPTQIAWRGMDLPLSIIEAMACNLPVVSMNFGCVAKLYGGVPGFKVVESDEGFAGGIAEFKAHLPRIETRKAVEGNDWGNLASKMLSIYKGA